jgi:sulfotransferase
MADVPQAPQNPAEPDAPAKPRGKAIYFLGALPRAGSTLISNVLLQNPRIHVTSSTSGLLNLLIGIRNHWEKMAEFKAMDKEEAVAARLRVLRGVVLAYFANVDKPVVIDKGRGWIGQIPFIEALLGRKVKIIAPVRDVRDILASFEKIVSRNPLQPTTQELAHPQQWETIEGRCQVWFAQNQPVGGPYRKLRDAMMKGFRDRLHFVDYDEFTAHPARCMRELYEFLGEEDFAHDFENVEQKTFEDDEVWKMPGLHTIRQSVKPQGPQWPKILPPDVAKRYPGTELWKKKKK